MFNPLIIKCPHCGADPNAPCHTPSWAEAKPHASRIALAETYNVSPKPKKHKKKGKKGKK